MLPETHVNVSLYLNISIYVRINYIKTIGVSKQPVPIGAKILPIYSHTNLRIVK